jgi:enoyl-CoA hydratase/carnithine racemase
MFERLRDVLSSAAAEPPRVLTLSAAGPAFCAGGDLGEMTALVGKPPELVRQRAHLAADVVRRLALFPAPTVAVVRGQAVGGGACLALACDRVLASEDAVLDLPFARLGTAGSDMLAPWMLTRRVGTRAALQLLLDGARLPASEALRRGLLDEVLPSPKLDNRVRSCVELWASGHPAGTRATKAAVLALETSAWDVDRQLEFEARLVAGVLSEGEQLHRPAVHNGQSGAS